MDVSRNGVPRRYARNLAMTHRRIVWTLALLCPALAIPALLGVAQEPAPMAAGIKWRTNYNLARKEASDKKLPLFIDFSTQRCVYCDKLDRYTFTDPQVAAILSTRCIPLRLDGDVEVKLVNDLNIRAYPTLVIAN